MNQRVPSAIYSKEFREQTVKQVTEEELSPKEAARRLSMPVKKPLPRVCCPTNSVFTGATAYFQLIDNLEYSINCLKFIV